MDNQGKADPNCDYSHHQQLIQQQQQQMSEDEIDLRRGPWTVEEDFTLINYIAHHGEGRWNSLARSAGLKRTGKSCRLRWLNYLRPDVRRGNITLEEQLLILELHSRWGNRWSKIAQHLPGRTDNEIKNYWRTRVQKHAKQLKCDVNSKQFKDTMRYLWMPRLVERIQAAGAGAASASAAPASSSTPAAANYNMNMSLNNFQAQTNNFNAPDLILPANLSGVARVQNMNAYTTPENSSAAASSESFGTPVSDLTECYNNYNNQGGSGSGSNNSSNNNINNNNNNNSSNQDYYHPGNHHQFSYGEQSLTSPTPAGAGYFNQGLDFMEQNGCQWMDGGDAASDALWNADEMWFFQQQFGSSNVV